MVLTLQLNASVSPPLTVNGEEIAQTKSAKLLGITIDEHLSLKKDQVCHVQSSAIYIWRIQWKLFHALKRLIMTSSMVIKNRDSFGYFWKLKLKMLARQLKTTENVRMREICYWTVIGIFGALMEIKRESLFRKQLNQWLGSIIPSNNHPYSF